MNNQRTPPIDLPGEIIGSESLPGVEAPRRGPVYGSKYAVAADHPLASIAAINVLQRGGNAVDATIAASAVNVVVKPYATQLGGDAFMLMWHKKSNTVECLNAGGRAPVRATLDRFSKGLPSFGAASSSVPGLVDAWMDLHRTYATLPLDVLLRPAIDYARNGFPVSVRLHDAMRLAATFDGRESAELRRIYLLDGARPYAEGQTLRQPQLAETLERMVELVERDGFYGEETGELIVQAMQEHGGIIGKDDLEQAAAHWHEPIKTTYAGVDVYEQAPPSQGFILLEALSIAEQFPVADWGLQSPEAAHVLIEAMKLAFADSRQYWADPLVQAVPSEELLSKEHARKRAQLIDLKRAGEPMPAVLGSDTTEFVVGDEDYAIAFIQSVFAPWGSRFVVPATGILMNNRLSAFSADPSHANVLAPGKRTVHTLNTFMALRDGELVIGGGTPGADFQVQSNLQTVVARLAWGLDLQSAIDSPRWLALAGRHVALEGRFAPALLQGLANRGHEVHVIAPWDTTVSRSQVIASRAEGGWGVASDLRGEGVGLAL